MSNNCATCGEPTDECGCDGIVCDFCGQTGAEVEIYHQCVTLGVICCDCDSSGEHSEYWDGEGPNGQGKDDDTE